MLYLVCVLAPCCMYGIIGVDIVRSYINIMLINMSIRKEYEYIAVNT